MPLRYLTDPCPPEQAFRFQNGASARSLDEFRRTVRAAPAEVLDYHRTHFAPWLRDVLGDPTLAERVRAEGERASDAEALRRSLDALLERAVPAMGPETGPAGRGRGSRLRKR